MQEAECPPYSVLTSLRDGGVVGRLFPRSASVTCTSPRQWCVRVGVVGVVGVVAIPHIMPTTRLHLIKLIVILVTDAHNSCFNNADTMPSNISVEYSNYIFFHQFTLLLLSSQLNIQISYRFFTQTHNTSFRCNGFQDEANTCKLWNRWKIKLAYRSLVTVPAR